MIARLEGTLVERDGDRRSIVDCGGVGYEVDVLGVHARRRCRPTASG